MTGERRLWFMVASRLGMSVEETRRRMTQGEFLEWCEFLYWEEARQTKMDLYLAQIAAEVRRSYVLKPNTVKMDSFLVRSRESRKVETSKGFWFAAVGLKMKP